MERLGTGHSRSGCNKLIKSNPSSVIYASAVTAPRRVARRRVTAPPGAAYNPTVHINFGDRFHAHTQNICVLTVIYRCSYDA